MNVDKARKIVDSWTKALINKQCPAKLSSVGADSISQVYNGLLLDLAYQYRLRQRGENRYRFSQEFPDLLEWYDLGAARMPNDFLADDIYDSVVKRPRGKLGLYGDLEAEASDYWWKVNPEYQNLLDRGTPSEFCRFLQQINPDEDLYWQKVFIQLGLPFSENSAPKRSPDR
jgi:hypothetical protein